MHLIDQQLRHMVMGEFEKAWQISELLEKDESLTQNERFRANFNRGWFKLNQGDYQAGFKLLEYGRSLNVYGGAKLPTNKPIWDGSDLNGKVVIMNCEGGFGDNIMSARFATEIHKRGGECIIICDPKIHSLFSRIVGVKKCIATTDVSTTYHDFWVPGFSCSWLFGHTVDNFPNLPYITPKYESVEVWKAFIKKDKKYNIGIRWSGNPKFEHQQFRIFPAELLINIHKEFPNIQFYSLQRDEDVRELPEEIVDFNHFLISWEDTAACIANLDLVISSCTSVAHLSAAMGKPTWIVVPLLPYHTWAYGGDHSPWYQKTTRIFRQEKFTEWHQPFDKIKQELIKNYS
jgi:hypothetical protein